MSSSAKLLCGIILFIIPMISAADALFLGMLKKRNNISFTEFQKSMFREGREHAGMFIILSLIAQVLADYTVLNGILEWYIRIGFPLAAVLISSSFFLAAMENGATKPNKLIAIRYVGSFLLMSSLITLGVGLIWSR